jgi:hypothetical protein
MIAEIGQTLGIVATVCGGLWVLYQYVDQKRQKNKADAESAAHEAETRSLESRKPFLELKLRLYVETTQVVGKLVAEPIASEEWRNAEKRFWSLYWSELSMVESESVEFTMIAIGKSVRACRETGEEAKKTGLRNGSYKLAHQIRAEIETDWSGERFVMDGQKRIAAISRDVEETVGDLD